MYNPNRKHHGANEGETQTEYEEILHCSKRNSVQLSLYCKACRCLAETVRIRALNSAETPVFLFEIKV